ncbi:MAG TPA: polysaccharide deacetylase family protein [Blastocatellia bacterium]|nr:polysaccharide deacetylase family protein [Blastocatellia bacterium]
MPGLRTLRRVGGRLKRRLSRRALVLLYHRVAEADTDPWQLAVTPRHFAEHLQVLRSLGRPASLQQLSSGLREGRLPRRAIVVTFDDGYADNLLNAKPLLEAHDVPATVFVATGYSHADREFWWDELDRLFLQPGALPRALRLNVRGHGHDWQLEAVADYDDALYRRHLSWRVWQKDAPTSRHAIYRSLWELMHPMSDDERQEVRKALLTWAGASGSARPTHRALTPEEIVELARGGLVEVGCHTVTHPQLSALSGGAQRDEIGRSKAQLEEMLGRRVASFAYPYGRECDYTRETVALVQEAGFDCACSTLPTVVARGTDLFQLPRVAVQDMDGESFARLISKHLHS